MKRLTVRKQTNDGNPSLVGVRARNAALEAPAGRPPRLCLSLLACPSQHFTKRRFELVWSRLAVGEVARWKVSPLRGAVPELGPKLHLSHPSRLGLSGAAGEGAGGGGGSYWPQRPLPASRPGPRRSRRP